MGARWLRPSVVAVAICGVGIAAFLLTRPNHGSGGGAAFRAEDVPRLGPLPGRPDLPASDSGTPTPPPAPDGGTSAPQVTDGGTVPDAGAPSGPAAPSEGEALSPGWPDEIEIAVTRDAAGSRFVLFKSFPGRTWRRQRKADGTWERFEEVREEVADRCDREGGGTDAGDQCELDGSPCPYLVFERRDDPGGLAWEVARLDRRDGGWVVGARRVLWGFALAQNPPEIAPELRANDLDGDGRQEVTVLASLEEPDADSFNQNGWTLAAILDGGDLHVQFVIGRVFWSVGGDTDSRQERVEVTWRLVDEDRDGVSDLKLRETRALDHEHLEGEPIRERGSRTAACPYDRGADRWTCPAFGQALPADASALATCPAVPPPRVATADAGASADAGRP